MHKKLFIIDGNSYCYRAYYAIRHLSNSKGMPTNAIYGFVAMLNKLIEKEKPDYLALSFDLSGGTFRHTKYEEYKANRKPMDEELVSQIPKIKDIVRAFNIPIYEIEGYEADDVIATIASKAEAKGIDVYAVTGDKDIFQIVREGVYVYHAHKDGLIFDRKRVREELGVDPEIVPDLIGLMGDSSDNIPGVPGIGPKTAVALLDKFGTIENLIKNIESITPESKRKLIEKNRDAAIMSKNLAILDIETPIKVNISDMRLIEPDKEKLAALYEEFEFKTFLRNVQGENKEVLAKNIIIDTEKALSKFVRLLKKQEKFAFDFETTSLQALRCEMVGVSFCFDYKNVYYIPCRIKNEDIATSSGKLDGNMVLEKLKTIFENENQKKIGHNIKYEIMVLKRYGIALKGIYFDTMIASYVINPSQTSHSLAENSLIHFNHKMTPITDLIGTGKKQITMDKVDLSKVVPYACDDSNITYRLESVLSKLLSERKLTKLFCDIEMPLVSVLADMEENGVLLNTDYLHDLSDQFGSMLEALTAEIYQESGEEFNINSPKQLAHILFEKLNYPIIKKTKTGYSTDEEVLKTLANSYELANKILKFRELSKLKSTYSDSLPQLVYPETHKIHTSYNQTVTATGRLSSSDPNLQNIPIRTEEGRKIRKAFTASPKNYLLISADYSQIELRILAHYAKDKTLIDAFQSNLDIHSYTASLIYNVPDKEVDTAMRDTAKTVNFGIMYGMGPFGLAKDLGVSIDEAKSFIDEYFKRYKKVKEYMDTQIETAKKKGYVETFLKRRRYIPDIKSSNSHMRHFAERTAINAPIQGSAADLIKIAMIQISETLKQFESKLILQVHDELIFDVIQREKEDIIEIIKKEMEEAMSLKVPLVVNLKEGSNWAELRAI